MRKQKMVIAFIALTAVCSYAKKLDFQETDKNKDGYLSLEELIQQHAAVNPKIPKKAIEKGFSEKDKDGDGKLSPEEYFQ